MKKHITLAAVLMLFALVFTGCEKKNEWSYFNNYSVDDIAGDYHYSNVSNAVEFLEEGEDVHICEDAILSIQKLSETTVEIHLKCPDEGYDRTFVGKPFNANNDFRIYLYHGMEEVPDYELHAIVYTNEKGDVRLHGYGRKRKGGDPVIGDYWENWYFDMIKN